MRHSLGKNNCFALPKKSLEYTTQKLLEDIESTVYYWSVSILIKTFSAKIATYWAFVIHAVFQDTMLVCLPFWASYMWSNNYVGCISLNTICCLTKVSICFQFYHPGADWGLLNVPCLKSTQFMVHISWLVCNIVIHLQIFFTSSLFFSRVLVYF